MEKVLHVETGNLFRKIVKKIIEPRGFQVLSTDNSVEAFSLIESNDINLIISGNELLDITGEEFVSMLSRGSFSKIPVIILTSTDSLELRTRFFSLGIVDYILKKDMNTARLENYFDSLIRQDELLHRIQKESIAVLDDSSFGLSVVRNIFELHKIRDVDYYTDPYEFLKESYKYSFFLVDLVLPEISGEEVITQLRQKQKDCVIIVVSGVTNFKTISHAMMYGADDYISKPYDNGFFMARFKANARTYFLYKELEQRAITDGLTGLYNHRYIVDFVGDLIMNKRGGSFCVLLLDIDHFKNVNDSFGHQIGDIVLRTISDNLREFFGESGVCGRYGGEEFLVVLKDTPLDRGIKMVEELRHRLSEQKYTENEFKITVSGGLAEHLNESSVEIIKRADDLLYKAKSNGRNRILYS